MPGEFKSEQPERQERSDEKSQSDIEVSRSRFHAQQAIGLLADPVDGVVSQSWSVRSTSALIHATLSVAAATRANVLAYQEEV